jgi:hypothetical protein
MKDDKYDAHLSHLVLGLVQNIRGQAYKLCPEEMSHEDRLAAASTYTLNNLFLAACEIAAEYEIPFPVLVRVLAARYGELMEKEEEKPIH